MLEEGVVVQMPGLQVAETTWFTTHLEGRCTSGLWVRRGTRRLTTSAHAVKWHSRFDSWLQILTIPDETGDVRGEILYRLAWRNTQPHQHMHHPHQKSYALLPPNGKRACPQARNEKHTPPEDHTPRAPVFRANCTRRMPMDPISLRKKGNWRQPKRRLDSTVAYFGPLSSEWRSYIYFIK